MVQIGYKKIFSDPKKLEQMLNLRNAGWAESSLTYFFNCSKSSISERLDKHGVPKPAIVYTVESIVSKVLPQKDTRWRMMGGEKTNIGKSYKDYLMPN